MTEKKQPNRIPAEDVADYRAWSLPPINDRGQVLPSAEKEARQQAQDAARRAGETIESVNIKGRLKGGMTAQQLQELVDAVEAEGFEQGRKKGYEKGMAEGYEAGQQQGLMEMRQQLVAEQQRFQRLAEALLDPLDEQDRELEQLLLDTVCTLTRSVVERELQTDSSEILTLVRRALAVLPAGSRNLRISLNPDDLALVEAYAEEHQLDWQFTGDPALMPGGCLVESAISRVDYSTEKRLADLLEQFVNKQFAGNGDESPSEYEAQSPPSDLISAPQSASSGEAEDD